jgi:glycosyltransferase involved in cell wall biosynthesis
LTTKIAFVVNVDYFFHSHRRSLEVKLSEKFQTFVVAGNSDNEFDYPIHRFHVKERVPTVRGCIQFYRIVKSLGRETKLIVVSPVMIFLCHFLLRRRQYIIYNFSGLGFLRSKSNLIRFVIFKLFKSYPVKGSRIFIVQNSDDLVYLAGIFQSKKRFHLNLIEGSGYSHSTTKIKSIQKDPPTIGYVGRIRKDKGILNLLRSVVEFNKNGVKINLVIWGKLDDENRHGFNKEELAEIAANSQFFKGWSDRSDIIYASFDWFCLPSNGEGLSKAAIEAASYGIPLALSNVPGNRDMIDGNGFFFEYNDEDTLLRVLEKIINQPLKEYTDFSERSRHLYESRWTMDSVYNKWLKLLQRHDTSST